MTQYDKTIYDGVKRGQIYKRQDEVLRGWETMLEMAMRSNPESFKNDVFPHFIQLVIEAARGDEERHQNAIKRIENLKQWISRSNFIETHAMSLTTLGYDNLVEMKKEVAEYSPDLLEEFAIFNKSLGDSFLLKDYEPNKNDSITASPLVAKENEKP